MDLVKFNDRSVLFLRDASARPDTPYADSKPNTRYVPIGASVIPHTEKLFSPKRSPRGPLSELLTTADSMCFDPTEFDQLTEDTIAALQLLASNPPQSAPPTLILTLNNALLVLKDLQEDRDALFNNLAALARA